MEEVLKLVKEEQKNLEALLEKAENTSIKEVQLLYDKEQKLEAVVAAIKAYNNVH